MERTGFLLVLSSPSGAGKTTICKKLLERDNQLRISISVTTRAKRETEIDGRDYFFTTKQKYDKMLENQELLEHAEIFGNFYGTPKNLVEEELRKGNDLLFDIDWQGVQQINNAKNDMVSIFILPPSMEELEERLKKRAEDSDEVVKNRMSKARNEISHWAEYDYVFINHDLEESIMLVEKIIAAERHKRNRNLWLAKFVDKL